MLGAPGTGAPETRQLARKPGSRRCRVVAWFTTKGSAFRDLLVACDINHRSRLCRVADKFTVQEPCYELRVGDAVLVRDVSLFIVHTKALFHNTLYTSQFVLCTVLL